MNEDQNLEIFTTLYKDTSHRGWLYRVAQVLRAHTLVTENARELHEHSGELIEMATIMSLFSENPMACFTDRKRQIWLLCGSA